MRISECGLKDNTFQSIAESAWLMVKLHVVLYKGRIE